MKQLNQELMLKLTKGYKNKRFGDYLFDTCSQKQDTLKSIIVKNLGCSRFLVQGYFPKLKKIYFYDFQAKVKFETKHLEQFLAQTPNLKTIEFDGHFNIHIANQYLYKIIKDRNVFGAVHL